MAVYSKNNIYTYKKFDNKRKYKIKNLITSKNSFVLFFC